MAKTPIQKGLIISDFTDSHLVKFFARDVFKPQTKIKVAPYGRVIETLINRNLPCWKPEPDFVVVWTQAEKIIASFGARTNFQKVSDRRILSEVDDFAKLIIKIASKVRTVIVPTWSIPTSFRGYGILERREGLGVRQVLDQMNLRLAKNFKGINNIYLLDSDRWFGPLAYNPQLWYLAKVPFTDEVFHQAISDIKAVLRANLGLSKKLIVVDLDDTLWGGIVGDLGWQKVNLGGHNFLGEAFKDFQKALKSLKNRGILLGIVSKNEEKVALEAIEKNPEMVLKKDDFVGWRINWEDKAKNIVDLTSQLNLGLQSVVFIDDNPVERARVKEALSEVTVPDWPEDKTLYRSTLLSLDLFDTASYSAEDLKRAKMYLLEGKRDKLKSELPSMEEWLKTLKIKVEIETLNEGNLPRTAQLLNKTNQMNLTTRRLTEKELSSWAKKKGNYLWTFRVSDRFGDSGLTGIASLNIEGKKAQIVDYILSCRVMGRKVEETVLAHLVRQAKKTGAATLEAKYLETAKNKPCFDFFARSGMAYEKKSKVFSWDLTKEMTFPKMIEVKEKNA